MRKLLIIPAFNEADMLVGLVEEIQRVSPTFDYVIVNDGSVDNTMEVCLAHNFHALNLCSNLGIGGAVQTGYQFALLHGYDIAVQYDGDGQHDASFLDELVAPICNGTTDFVIGSRFIMKKGFQSTRARRMGIRWLNFVLRRLTSENITDATSGFRAGNAKVIALFSANYPSDYPEPESVVDLSRNKMRICEVSVNMRERKTGKSSIRLFGSFYYMLKVTSAIFVSTLKQTRR